MYVRYVPRSLVFSFRLRYYPLLCVRPALYTPTLRGIWRNVHVVRGKRVIPRGFIAAANASHEIKEIGNVLYAQRRKPPQTGKKKMNTIVGFRRFVYNTYSAQKKNTPRSRFTWTVSINLLYDV